MSEVWDVYNEYKELTGRTAKSNSELSDKEYHLIVNVWIYNSKGEFLVQKRSMNKDGYPGLYAAHGGSVLSGESSVDGAVREVYEEIGISINRQELLLVESMLWNNGIFDNYIVRSEIDIDMTRIDANEVEEVKWMTIEEVESSMTKGTFIDYLGFYGKEYFERLRELMVTTNK